MFLLVSFGLVLAAAALFVVGVVGGELTAIYLSMAASGGAGLALMVSARLGRERRPATPAGPAPLAAEPVREPATVGATPAAGEALAATTTTVGTAPSGPSVQPGRTVDDDWDDDLGGDFPIADYDDLREDEVVPLLAMLDEAELDLVEERERLTKRRRAVLDRIDEVRTAAAGEGRAGADAATGGEDRPVADVATAGEGRAVADAATGSSAPGLIDLRAPAGGAPADAGQDPGPRQPAAARVAEAASGAGAASAAAGTSDHPETAAASGAGADAGAAAGTSDRPEAAGTASGAGTGAGASSGSSEPKRAAAVASNAGADAGASSGSSEPPETAGPLSSGSAGGDATSTGTAPAPAPSPRPARRPAGARAYGRAGPSAPRRATPPPPAPAAADEPPAPTAGDGGHPLGDLAAMKPNEVVAALAALDVDQLAAVRADEEAGPRRRTVLAAVDRRMSRLRGQGPAPGA